MPFVSTAQRGYMWTHHPAMARRWQAHTPKGKKLPRHVDDKDKQAALLDHLAELTAKFAFAQTPTQAAGGVQPIPPPGVGGSLGKPPQSTALPAGPMPAAPGQPAAAPAPAQQPAAPPPLRGPVPSATSTAARNPASPQNRWYQATVGQFTPAAPPPNPAEAIGSGVQMANQVRLMKRAAGEYDGIGYQPPVPAGFGPPPGFGPPAATTGRPQSGLLPTNAAPEEFAAHLSGLDDQIEELKLQASTGGPNGQIHPQITRLRDQIRRLEAYRKANEERLAKVLSARSQADAKAHAIDPASAAGAKEVGTARTQTAVEPAQSRPTAQPADAPGAAHADYGQDFRGGYDKLDKERQLLADFYGQQKKNIVADVGGRGGEYNNFGLGAGENLTTDRSWRALAGDLTDGGLVKTNPWLYKQLQAAAHLNNDTNWNWIRSGTEETASGLRRLRESDPERYKSILANLSAAQWYREHGSEVDPSVGNQEAYKALLKKLESSGGLDDTTQTVQALRDLEVNLKSQASQKNLPGLTQLPEYQQAVAADPARAKALEAASRRLHELGGLPATPDELRDKYRAQYAQKYNVDPKTLSFEAADKGLVHAGNPVAGAGESRGDGSLDDYRAQAAVPSGEMRALAPPTQTGDARSMVGPDGVAKTTPKTAPQAAPPVPALAMAATSPAAPKPALTDPPWFRPPTAPPAAPPAPPPAAPSAMAPLRAVDLIGTAPGPTTTPGEPPTATAMSARLPAPGSPPGAVAPGGARGPAGPDTPPPAPHMPTSEELGGGEQWARWAAQTYRQQVEERRKAEMARLQSARDFVNQYRYAPRPQPAMPPAVPQAMPAMPPPSAPPPAFGQAAMPPSFQAAIPPAQAMANQAYAGYQQTHPGVPPQFGAAVQPPPVQQPVQQPPIASGTLGGIHPSPVSPGAGVGKPF
jgi:hypothetical protein